VTYSMFQISGSVGAGMCYNVMCDIFHVSDQWQRGCWDVLQRDM